MENQQEVQPTVSAPKLILRVRTLLQGGVLTPMVRIESEDGSYRELAVLESTATGTELNCKAEIDQFLAKPFEFISPEPEPAPAEAGN